MSQLKKFSALVVVFISLLFLSTASAEEEPADKIGVTYEKIGDPEKCITTARIKNTRIMSDDAIVFIMRGDRLFLSELPKTCRGLAKGGTFARPDYRRNHRKMCSGDVFNPYQGGVCQFGSFQEIKLIVSDTQGKSNES